MIVRIAANTVNGTVLGKERPIPNEFYVNKGFRYIHVDGRLSIDCSVDLFNSIPKQKGDSGDTIAGTKRKLMVGMPHKFRLDDIKSIAAKLGIKDRTLTRWIKGFVDSGYLDKVGHGEYKHPPWRRWRCRRYLARNRDNAKKTTPPLISLRLKKFFARMVVRYVVNPGCLSGVFVIYLGR